MKVEDDTGVLPVGDPEHSHDGPPLVDHGPWSAEAVPLGKGNDRRSSPENIRYAASKPPRWIVLAAITCAAGLIAAPGMNVIGGTSGVQTERPQPAPTRSQLTASASRVDGIKTRRQVTQRRQLARLASRRRSPDLPHHPTQPPSSPTYAPAPQPVPTPEPVTPSPAPAPASAPGQTTKSPSASNSAVSKEFGFER